MPKNEKENEITKELLEKQVKNCIDHNDYQGAKNYVKSWGPYIKDFYVDVELQKLEKEELKSKK